jgi:hypothetical protein
MNGSAANPDAPNSPGVAIPETLPLPDAAAVIAVGDIGRTAISVTVAGSIIVSRSIVPATRQRAADDSAADHSGGEPGAETALGMGRSRR